MMFFSLYSLLCIALFPGFSYEASGGNISMTPSSSPKDIKNPPSTFKLFTMKPLTHKNSTSENDGLSPWENKEMFVRALIVVACVSLIAVVYLVVRCLRVKHQMNKSRKYGLITTNEDKMELRPLGQEDDEDDLTVFDRTSSGQTNQRPFDLVKNGMKIKDKAP